MTPRITKRQRNRNAAPSISQLTTSLSLQNSHEQDGDSDSVGCRSSWLFEEGTFMEQIGKNNSVSTEC
ncbi:unnamed protein product [Protopolystoma xenopodis]|uniref:Uncharacterized protein n=1 Tax=Protopolystoma xenopodis TaxID=117903 RepID=A0A448WHA1_9PLAT|nr:unnamed protein product [Protopolystoma xenopodis]